jgi:hypothetical protein
MPPRGRETRSNSPESNTLTSVPFPPLPGAQAYNVSDSGEYMWAYTSNDNQATFMVDMARHAQVGLLMLKWVH